jgi:alanyl-tRNA synthetase
MMTVNEIRQKFLDFFEGKGHKIVPAAPIVNKNDPTLMFINSGMAQFKDYFLGNETPPATRIADTQKCLRVSGKHNDLEDVGRDSYHQTMFEMLGNWSFGDYFKEESIAWAWELLTEVYKIDKDRIYITTFEGDKEDGVPADSEAVELWKKWISADRILPFDKKDNFWEMGAQGPCGPCSEIHVDIRPEADRAKVDGKTLVNMDHPQVIEIWNLVFMEFNRLADGSLVPLAQKCIDTGMGLERLCMVLQGKTSNYDTDAFSTYIDIIEKTAGIKYTNSYAEDAYTDIAMRVIADHIRAVALVIADGQMPSNTGAGYVVRRVLRRAVRYYYSFLNITEPFIYKLLPICADLFKDIFPELKAQEALIKKTIQEEEKAFLRTLARGLVRFDNLDIKNNVVSGSDAFELFDTYGFPSDLTELLAKEKGWSVDKDGYKKLLAEQKKRSQKDAAKETSDWVEILEDPSVNFVGYDKHQTEAKVVKHRKIVAKGKEQYQIVLNETPFYAEGGGQIGDTGLLYFGEEKIPVIDTKRENNLIVHWVKQLPANIQETVNAQINVPKRQLTENNHSATHLLHAALRQVLGSHIQQKGSLVSDKKLRFDFSHHEKVTDEQIQAIEAIVNAKIRANISLKEQRNVPIAEAEKSGAMMLFGEKYGESVRIITFDDDYSKELCGGCHVDATGTIGLFKITVETSVATGIRRIEALTAKAAEDYVQKELNLLAEVKALLKNPKNLTKAVEDLQEANKKLKKDNEKIGVLQAQLAKGNLKAKALKIGAITLIASETDIVAKDAIKQLSNDLEREFDNLVLVLGANNNGKALLTVTAAQSAVKEHGIHAGNIIKTIAKEVNGGGGGQPFFATAGGKNPAGIPTALLKAQEMIHSLVG